MFKKTFEPSKPVKIFCDGFELSKILNVSKPFKPSMPVENVLDGFELSKFQNVSKNFWALKKDASKKDVRFSKVIMKNWKN